MTLNALGDKVRFLLVSVPALLVAGTAGCVSMRGWDNPTDVTVHEIGDNLSAEAVNGQAKSTSTATSDEPSQITASFSDATHSDISGVPDEKFSPEAAEDEPATTEDHSRPFVGNDTLARSRDVVPVAQVSFNQSSVQGTATALAPDAYVAEALRTHPRIRAARQRMSAVVHRIVKDSSLPDPMLSESFWPFNGNALQTAGGAAASQLGLVQAVPWPEKLDAKAAIARREVEMARAAVFQAEREIEEAVRLACIEIAFADDAISILDEMQQLLEDLANVADAAYRSGGSQQDVLRIEVELDRLQQQRADLLKQKRTAQADLAALLSRPAGELPEVKLQLDTRAQIDRLDSLLQLAEQCNPELQGLAWQIARDRQKQRLACLQQYPDFQVGMNWLILTENDAISPVATGNDNFAFTVGMTLPIWRDKIRAGIQEAAHQTAGSIQSYLSERNMLFGKIRRLVATADSLAEQIRIYEERLIPHIEHTLEINLADYRGKRSEFFSVVETYRDLLAFELQKSRLAATMSGVIVQIERQVGCPVSQPATENER